MTDFKKGDIVRLKASMYVHTHDVVLDVGDVGVYMGEEVSGGDPPFRHHIVQFFTSGWVLSLPRLDAIEMAE